MNGCGARDGSRFSRGSVGQYAADANDRSANQSGRIVSSSAILVLLVRALELLELGREPALARGIDHEDGGRRSRTGSPGRPAASCTGDSADEAAGETFRQPALDEERRRAQPHYLEWAPLARILVPEALDGRGPAGGLLDLVQDEEGVAGPAMRRAASHCCAIHSGPRKVGSSALAN